MRHIAQGTQIPREIKTWEVTHKAAAQSKSKPHVLLNEGLREFRLGFKKETLSLKGENIYSKSSLPVDLLIHRQ